LGVTQHQVATVPGTLPHITSEIAAFNTLFLPRKYGIAGSIAAPKRNSGSAGTLVAPYLSD
jgi:hypothetical protein